MWLTCRCYNSRKRITSALKSVQWIARLLETSFSVCEAHSLSLPPDDSVVVWGCTLCDLTARRSCLLSQTPCPSTFHWTYSKWLMSISPPWHFELQAIGIVVWLNHILKVFLKTCVTKSFHRSHKQEFFRSHSRLTITLVSYRHFGMKEDITSLFPSVCCWFFFKIDFHVLKIRVFYNWVMNVESQKYLTFLSVHMGVEDPEPIPGSRNCAGLEWLDWDAAAGSAPSLTVWS